MGNINDQQQCGQSLKMPFTKLQKNSAYYSRYQTKYKRRRVGKTDYYARKRLIPQAKNRFPGYDIESKELDADTLRKYIFGGHVAEYMETLADDDEERYTSQFQGYIDDEIEADGLEELYTEAHKAIREDPFKKVDDAGEKKTKEEWKKEALKFKGRKLTKEEKVERVKAKIAELKE